jgi:hypothetical protein
MSEEMFIKETETEAIEVKPKKKRQLTEKQLEGLRKGREKMAEKRKMKKALTEKKKALQKKDGEASKQNLQTEKKERKAKKKAVEKSIKQELTFKEKKERAEKSSSKFNKIKLKALDSIKTSKELEEFEKVMKGVSNDMAKNPEKLYEYLREHADRLAPEKHRKAYMERQVKNSKGKKSPKKRLETITETTEEKKPNLKLNIENV